MEIEAELSDALCKRIAGLFRALAHPTRIKIVRQLRETSCNVNTLHQKFGGSQANISKHLGVLLDSSLVTRRREGVENIYELVNQQALQLCCCALRCIKNRLDDEVELFEQLGSVDDLFN